MKTVYRAACEFFRPIIWMFRRAASSKGMNVGDPIRELVVRYACAVGTLAVFLVAYLCLFAVSLLVLRLFQ